MTRVFHPFGWRRNGYKVPEQECVAAFAFEKLWSKIFRIYTLSFSVLVIVFQLYGTLVGLFGALLVIILYYRNVTKKFSHYPAVISDQKHDFFSDHIRIKASAMSYVRLLTYLAIGIVFFIYFSRSVFSSDASFLVRYVGGIAGAIFGLASIVDTVIKLTTKIKYNL